MSDSAQTRRCGCGWNVDTIRHYEPCPRCGCQIGPATASADSLGQLDRHPGPAAWLKQAAERATPGSVLSIPVTLYGEPARKEQRDADLPLWAHTRASLAALLDANGLELREVNDSTASAVLKPFQHASAPRLLINLTETFSREYTAFVEELNAFARPLGLREFKNWSKIWEYPRIWLDGLSELDWNRIHLLDIGSEQSPWPWYLASKGAQVTIVEASENWIPQWESIRDQLGVAVDWKIAPDCRLPVGDASYDVVTSFSVLEHQHDKATAIDEALRVLKAGGLFGLSFDLHLDGFGMTYPDWGGSPCSMDDFERFVGNRPEFEIPSGLDRSQHDIPAFLEWHRTTAPHHNYACAAVVLKKKARFPWLKRSSLAAV